MRGGSRDAAGCSPERRRGSWNGAWGGPLTVGHRSLEEDDLAAGFHPRIQPSGWTSGYELDLEVYNTEQDLEGKNHHYNTE